jgi:hypothetical protein
MTAEAGTRKAKFPVTACFVQNGRFKRAVRPEFTNRSELWRHPLTSRSA